jgi:hypothetical protein
LIAVKPVEINNLETNPVVSFYKKTATLEQRSKIAVFGNSFKEIQLLEKKLNFLPSFLGKICELQLRVKFT